jgi:putative PEP-CTERM system histidine kinase
VVVTLHVAVAVVAGVSSFVLAAVGLALGRPGWIKRGFAVGMAMFGIQALATAAVLNASDVDASPAGWLMVREAARLIAPVAWAVFLAALARHHAAPLPRLIQVGGTVGLAGCIVAFGCFATLGGPYVVEAAGRVHQSVLTPIGVASASFQLVGTVAVLAGLEACLRTSRGPSRRRTKFVVLGLGGVFLVQFYVLTQVVLFHALTATQLETEMASLLIGNAVLAVGVARSRLSGGELAVSRALVYRSVTVGILGGYLLVVGGVSWLLRFLEIPEQTFWVTLAVFVLTLTVAALLLSEEARWQVKRFIGRHVYRSKYDYREQWIAFTKRFGALPTLEKLGQPLLETMTEAVGGDAAVLYIGDEASQHFRLAAAVRTADAPTQVQAAHRLPAMLVARQKPMITDVPAGWGGPNFDEAFPGGSVAVPLLWRGELLGFAIFGPERTGTGYTPEDLEFMATVGQQATGSIVTARLSEDLARTREFDAFARVASFVMHDLKNLISGMSLLSQNAVKYLDDPEFQKDTIRTLSRTVERMQGLLARLSAGADALVVCAEPVDLRSVVREAVEGVAVPDRVKLVVELGQTPPVSADSEALQRAIHNLLKNATQAIAGEGSVAVTLQHVGDTVVLRIADTGCGMSDEFIAHSLFVPFRTTKRGGWGIGLFQVKEIVERHGGELTVTSKEGSGTTFEISLPCQ